MKQQSMIVVKTFLAGPSPCSESCKSILLCDIYQVYMYLSESQITNHQPSASHQKATPKQPRAFHSYSFRFFVFYDMIGCVRGEYKIKIMRDNEPWPSCRPGSTHWSELAESKLATYYFERGGGVVSRFPRYSGQQGCRVVFYVGARVWTDCLLARMASVYLDGMYSLSRTEASVCFGRQPPAHLV